ncbi:MAG TPA: ATP-binding protein, partial [Gemmatimonadaceae bacterium]
VVSVDTDDQGNPLRLTVRDTGIGIPAHRLAAIFNVFEQAESSTSRRFGGTGLGLAISRSLCQLMGHHLEVESTEGKGTTMRIRLGVPSRSWRRATPAASPSVSSRPSLAIEAAPLALVVDDDMDARVLLGHILEDAGCRVEHAATGIEGLRMTRELRPAIIFLDLRLPQISGFDVFRILQEDEALKAIPVVIVSVVATESRGALQGAVAYVDKPVSREQVADLVRRWLPAAAAH